MTQQRRASRAVAECSGDRAPSMAQQQRESSAAAGAAVSNHVRLATCALGHTSITVRGPPCMLHACDAERTTLSARMLPIALR
jgi:hypothetical protein